MADLMILCFKTHPFGSVSGVKREMFEAAGKVVLLGFLISTLDNLDNLF
ncbi:hypothetical protein [Ruegeria arenilitoris]|nr:hypothetical protein [Ruegeria arenilitoris]